MALLSASERRVGFTLLLRPTVAWLACVLGLTAAFHLDYWAAVDLLQAREIWISTSFDGTPMPQSGVFDVASQIGLPFGLLGLAVAARDFVRGRRLIGVLDAGVSIGLILISVPALRFAYGCFCL